MQTAQPESYGERIVREHNARVWARVALGRAARPEIGLLAFTAKRGTVERTKETVG